MTLLGAPKRMVEFEVDGAPVKVFEGQTILDGLNQLGVATPTLCYGETLTPANVCRVCVVEIEGARVLAPSCSRKAEPGMKVRTDSDARPPLAEAGAGVPRLLGRPLHRPGRAGLRGASTTPGPSATGRRRRPTPSATASAPATTRSPTASPPPPCTRR